MAHLVSSWRPGFKSHSSQPSLSSDSFLLLLCKTTFLPTSMPLSPLSSGGQFSHQRSWERERALCSIVSFRFSLCFSTRKNFVQHPPLSFPPPHRPPPPPPFPACVISWRVFGKLWWPWKKSHFISDTCCWEHSSERSECHSFPLGLLDTVSRRAAPLCNPTNQLFFLLFLSQTTTLVWHRGVEVRLCRAVKQAAVSSSRKDLLPLKTAICLHFPNRTESNNCRSCALLMVGGESFFLLLFWELSNDFNPAKHTR